MNRNIALIVLDSARKDAFDTFATSLQKRAEIDVSECRAASNWSPSSHGSMITGTLPHVNGIHAHNPNFDHIEPADTFFDAYQDYRKLGISSNLFAGRRNGFDRYFDEFVGVSRHSVLSGVTEIDAFRAESDQEGLRLYMEYLRHAKQQGTLTRSFVNGLIFKYHDLTDGTALPRLWDFGTRTSIRIARHRLTQSEQPTFLFMNLMETHNPFANSIWYRGKGVPMSWTSNVLDTYTYNNLCPDEQPPDYARNYRALYEASIRYTSAQLVKFIDWCDETLDAPTTFVITGDHGEQLGNEMDHGLISHVGRMSESLLHVPLLVVNPPVEQSIGDGQYFSHLELPILMRGLTADELRLPHRDRIAAEVIGSAPPEDTENYAYWDRMIRAAYEGRDKFVWDSLGDKRRYLVGDEPCRETEAETDVEIPEAALAHFETSIEEFKGQFDSERPKAWVADAPTERLQDLGYL